MLTTYLVAWRFELASSTSGSGDGANDLDEFVVNVVIIASQIFRFIRIVPFNVGADFKCTLRADGDTKLTNRTTTTTKCVCVYFCFRIKFPWPLSARLFLARSPFVTAGNLFLLFICASENDTQMCRHRCLFCYVLTMSSRSHCHPALVEIGETWKEKWIVEIECVEVFGHEDLCCFRAKTKFNQSQRLRVYSIQLECFDGDGLTIKWIKYLYVWFLIAKRLLARRRPSPMLMRFTLASFSRAPIRITRKIVLGFDGASQLFANITQPGNSDTSSIQCNFSVREKTTPNRAPMCAGKCVKISPW